MSNSPGDKVRVDVWTWAVRLFPSRSTATSAARGGHIKINGKSVKPAQTVNIGDTISTRYADVERIVVVKSLITRRVGAEIARTHYEDQSPAREKSKDTHLATRDRGAGRPTKRDRRLIDCLRGY